jgi:hypothetical protein
LTTSLDIYAMTNPALGGALLWVYLRGAAGEGQALELPLLFLPVPLLLSSTVADTFKGTNSRTGLFAWLNRNPGVTVGLAERVTRTAPITRTSLLYAARTGLIATDSENRFLATGAVSDRKLAKAGPAVKPLFTLAKQFGSWVGQVGSTRDVLYAFGITL